MHPLLIITIIIIIIIIIIISLFLIIFNLSKFYCTEGKSKFSEHVLNEGHEMKTIQDTMSIIHLENNHRKINTLEMGILKAASSKYVLNDVIAGQNYPIYKLLPTSVI